jgi:ubiquinone/menaquinone biosynthesis C-methylase UbiE
MNASVQISSSNFGLSEAFKALGDSLRFGIVRLMQQDSFGVLELCDLFDVRQPAMSHHLKIMVEAGLLCSRREGNSLFYRRMLPDQTNSPDALRTLFGLIDEVELSAEIQQALDELRELRTQRSLEFFQKNSERFRSQQDLIAGYGEYGKTIEDAVRALPLNKAPLNAGLWVEVGSGEGELLSAIAPEFSNAVALDVSEELLNRARTRVGDLDNVDFVLGELNADLYAGKADLVSCNMVLHHVASPADLIGAMAASLKKGGFLLLTDLASHDQEWARESCGDLWLGFEREELLSIAGKAGLHCHSEQYLALRNGFRVQVLIFEK